MCIFWTDQSHHEEAHEDDEDEDEEEISDDSKEEVSSSLSQETKRNHEAVFQETKPRITRRHSYGNYGSKSRPNSPDHFEPNFDQQTLFFFFIF